MKGWLSRKGAEDVVHVCEVESWCPIERDELPLGNEWALMKSAADYTVLIKNSVAFPYFGPQFIRNNIVSKNGTPCYFQPNSGNNLCQIFRLGDIVSLAGDNFNR